MSKDGPYVVVQRVDFGINSDISIGVDGEAVLYFIYVAHLVSGVIVKPKYLKVFNCFILSLLQRMIHTGMPDCFEMTMHPFFFAYS